jgi:branched-chain amino acid transport system permease protein
MSQLLLNMLFVGSELFLPALGFSIIYGLEGYFSFSFAMSASLAGYAFYMAHIQLSLNLIISASFGILVAMFWEPASRFFIFKPLIRRGAKPLSCLLSSIGLNVAGTECLKLWFGPEIKRIVPPDVMTVKVLGGILTQVQCTCIVTAVLCAGTCALLLKKTTTGMLWSAVRQNSHLCSCLGVNVERVRLIGCIVGSSIMAMAGLLTGADVGIDNNTGINILLMGVTVSILSGGKKPINILLWSFLIGILRESISWTLGSAWKDTILFLTLTMVIFVRCLYRPISFEFQDNAVVH